MGKKVVIDMFPFIEQSLQKDIKFRIDSMNVSIVSNYLGVMLTIAKINLNLNIPVQNTSEKGPGYGTKTTLVLNHLICLRQLVN